MGDFYEIWGTAQVLLDSLQPKKTRKNLGKLLISYKLSFNVNHLLIKKLLNTLKEISDNWLDGPWKVFLGFFDRNTFNCCKSYARDQEDEFRLWITFFIVMVTEASIDCYTIGTAPILDYLFVMAFILKEERVRLFRLGMAPLSNEELRNIAFYKKNGLSHL